MSTPAADVQFAVQVVSDLHLEFESNAQCTAANYTFRVPTPATERASLALLGDIGYPFDESYARYVAACAERFRHVFVVCGNHEYYKQEHGAVVERVAQLCAAHDNVHFLNGADDDVVELDGVLVCGATLWT
eukprot:CAMPEP_0198351250 /NCGR_PEP_ID=MMETSP1450-20131203/102059_1 /TAXON_ID=753684 ORGANISM="Madagascaria erythrocladiodes, Strain CCMP3234" /NCGR_SAMPLE_ID=MMETSP1450 /ASSEMBLY_ACC=CAM_ASM_001115 /LENGTH=131 /DNA_ID=CAMNT_0044057145 /DNA_START=1 /DNA_END=392 /DNA_ORIENTATION=-